MGMGAYRAAGMGDWAEEANETFLLNLLSTANSSSRDVGETPRKTQEFPHPRTVSARLFQGNSGDTIHNS